ncbi:hypothetical protein HDU98_010199 [Podochytrium sp. JEL0797]|nr:hypothetical protein HDU98_010199 [Podochytrium sp. JEL0797]
MHLPTLLASLALATSTLITAQCTKPIVRQEWSTLSSAQKAQYISSIQQLAARPQNPAPQVNLDPSIISLHDFVNIHARSSPWAHGSAEFYPYHRAMMWKYEQALATVGWTIGAPYWDWPAVNQNWWDPSASDIFSAAYFGAATPTDTTNFCVPNGPFSAPGYTVAVLDTDTQGYSNGIHANSQCLRRCADVGVAATYPADIVARLGATTFAAFRGDTLAHTDDQDPNGFHSAGHEILGGSVACASDMGNPSISPNDPFFWIHHSLVDKVWWRWQTRCKNFKVDYSGPLTVSDPIDPLGTLQAVSSQNVDSYGVTVASLLDTQGSLLCYTYSSSPGDLAMPPITCPDFNGAPDPGVNPDPTAWGAKAAATSAAGTSGVKSGAPAASATAGASVAVVVVPPITEKSSLDQVLQSVVGMALQAVQQGGGKKGVVVFGREEVGGGNSTGVVDLYGEEEEVVGEGEGGDEGAESGTQNVVDGAEATNQTLATGNYTLTLNGTEITNVTLVDNNSTKTATTEGGSYIPITPSANDTRNNSLASGNHTLFINGTTTTLTNATLVNTNATTTLPANSTAEPEQVPLHYEIQVTETNTTAITFLAVNQTIEVPADNSLRYVYNSYVESFDPEGKIIRHYLEQEEIEYKRIPGAPENVRSGHPCYKMQPSTMSEHWIHHHQLNRVKIRNAETRIKMRIDRENVENCGPVGGRQ